MKKKRMKPGFRASIKMNHGSTIAAKMRPHQTSGICAIWRMRRSVASHASGIAPPSSKATGPLARVPSASIAAEVSIHRRADGCENESSRAAR